MEENTFSAPGKLLLLGGYSVLERPMPSYPISIDSYVHARVSGESGDRLRLVSMPFNLSCEGTVETATGELTANFPGEFTLLKTAAELAVRYAAGLGFRTKGMSLTADNDPEFGLSRKSDGRLVKSGLGSSAALTVAVIGSIFKLYGIDATGNDALHKLSQVAHSLATGKIGSGFDVAAAVYGTIVYSRFSPDIVKRLPPDFSNDDLVGVVKAEWDYSVERLDFPPELIPVVANIKNESASTVSLVSKVLEFKARDPDAYWEILRQMDRHTRDAIAALRRIKNGEDASDGIEAFGRGLDESRKLRKELGVKSQAEIEPDDLTELIAQSNAHGALVSELPGAGGRDSILSICKTGGDLEKLRAFWGSRPELETLNLKVRNSQA